MIICSGSAPLSNLFLSFMKFWITQTFCSNFTKNELSQKTRFYLYQQRHFNYNLQREILVLEKSLCRLCSRGSPGGWIKSSFQKDSLKKQDYCLINGDIYLFELTRTIVSYLGRKKKTRFWKLKKLLIWSGAFLRKLQKSSS